MKRALECLLVVIFTALALLAALAGNWRFLLGFGVLAIAFGLPSRTWTRTLSMGNFLRYLVIAISVFYVSV